MPKRIILLSGPISAGKSTLAASLQEKYGITPVKTKEALINRVSDSERIALQNAGEDLDRSTNGTWVVEELTKIASTLAEDVSLVVDAVRTQEQIDAFRRAFGRAVTHIHLDAPDSELEARFDLRKRTQSGEPTTYAEARTNPTEAQVRNLEKDADIVVDTRRSSPTDVLTRAAARLRLLPPLGEKFVDVLVGGQYGSEGKGNVAAYLAPEYQLLVRVGGPNAGHQVRGETDEITIHHHLPSGTTRSDARLLLAPGCVLLVDDLLNEIADSKVDEDRLSIDPQAMIISPEDKIAEEELVKEIASTGRGVGAATARRVRDRFVGSSVRLAKDEPALLPYIRPAYDVLEDAYRNRDRILLEGTQGTGLSLLHGFYPHVTSRDTTIAGCLSEAGIPPNRVRRTVMVCRTHPIRVQNPPKGSSGPMSQEIDWAEVGRRSGYEAKQLEKQEITSTTRRRRRVGEFDWTLLRKAAALNGPSDIALTFVDHINIANAKARRFEQLTEETIRFIEEVGRVAGCPVSLISTRFHYRSIIDRRTWHSRNNEV